MCIRDRRYGSLIPLCQHAAAFIPHLLHVNSLIGGSRITVIYPEEGADSHILSRLTYGFHAVRGDIYDFSRSQFFVIRVAQVDICLLYTSRCV